MPLANFRIYICFICTSFKSRAWNVNYVSSPHRVCVNEISPHTSLRNPWWKILNNRTNFIRFPFSMTLRKSFARIEWRRFVCSFHFYTLKRMMCAFALALALAFALCQCVVFIFKPSSVEAWTEHRYNSCCECPIWECVVNFISRYTHTHSHTALSSSNVNIENETDMVSVCCCCRSIFSLLVMCNASFAMVLALNLQHKHSSVSFSFIGCMSLWRYNSLSLSLSLSRRCCCYFG